MFENILIYFVVIPLVMLGGIALCKNIKQIRAVAVVGSLALVGLSIALLLGYLEQRAAGATAEMLYVNSWSWFAPLNINLAVGVDGISVAMLLLSAIIFVYVHLVLLPDSNDLPDTLAPGGHLQRK